MATATVNIRRDVKDAFYRYKMPKLLSKIEGKGNGIKTVIPNMVDIAKSLNRPPTYVTKFFGAELGALTNWDEKVGRYIVNGAHDAEKLQALLDVFITKFVLCQNCENPETDLTVKKDGSVWRTCKACGHRSTVDMLHKLITFIRTNPPPKPPKKPKVKPGVQPTNGKPEANVVGMIALEDIDDGMENIAANRKVDEDDWADVSGGHQEDELAGLSAKVRSNLTLLGDHDGETDPLDAFGDLLICNPAVDSKAILQEIEKRAIRRDKAVAVIVQVLLAGDSLKGLQARGPLFRALLKDEKDKKAFLGGLERLAGITNPSLLDRLPVLLRAAYQFDFIDDEIALSWRSHISKRYVSKEIGLKVRAAAEPFFVWLSESESEEDDDDDYE